jgi:hypothetical protein
MNTTSQSLFVVQHPDPEELLDETSTDFPGPRVTAILPKDIGKRGSTRNSQVLYRDSDYHLAMVENTVDPFHPRVVLSADVRVEDRDGRLTAVLPDGAAFDLLDVYGNAMTGKMLDKFTIRADAEHSPRVTVDRVVLARETWLLPADGPELAFADDKSEARRFVRTARWRRARGLPRFVFVVSPTEPRPFYVDFDSPVYVNIFTKALRRLAREQPQARLRISEMLPTPEQTWLTDDRGQRYTSELRLVAFTQDRAVGVEPTGAGS